MIKSYQHHAEDPVDIETGRTPHMLSTDSAQASEMSDNAELKLLKAEKLREEAELEYDIFMTGATELQKNSVQARQLKLKALRYNLAFSELAQKLPGVSTPQMARSSASTSSSSATSQRYLPQTGTPPVKMATMEQMLMSRQRIMDKEEKEKSVTARRSQQLRVTKASLALAQVLGLLSSIYHAHDYCAIYSWSRQNSRHLNKGKSQLQNRHGRSASLVSLST